MAAIVTRRSIMDRIEHRVLEVVEEVQVAANERAARVNRRAARIIREAGQLDGISKARGYSDAAHGRTAATAPGQPTAYLEDIRPVAYDAGFALYLEETAAHTY